MTIHEKRRNNDIKHFRLLILLKRDIEKKKYRTKVLSTSRTGGAIFAICYAVLDSSKRSNHFGVYLAISQPSVLNQAYIR